jgi:hypothetical protein
LDVISELRLPEWGTFERELFAGEPDVRISIRTGPIDFGTATPVQGEYRFFVKEVGWFRVRDGREIVLQPLDSANPRRVRIFLLSSAWGALLYQRKSLVIHASAVQIADGGAVLFCARRGEGKSTLAALLGVQGCTLVSDDFCCLDVREGEPPAIYPSIPRVRLWSDAIRQLGWETARSEADTMRLGKFQYALAGNTMVDPLPIREIYLLGWGETGIERLAGFSALRRFLSAARWRTDLLMGVGSPAEYLQQCANLLRQVPVSALRRPKHLEVAPEGVRFLTEYWRHGINCN